MGCDAVYFGINQQPFQQKFKPSECDLSLFPVYWSDTSSESPLTNASLQICALLGYYTTNSGNSLQMFRDELSLPFQWSRPEMSVMNRHYSLRNSPEERSSYLLGGGKLAMSQNVSPVDYRKLTNCLCLYVERNPTRSNSMQIFIYC